MTNKEKLCIAATAGLSAVVLYEVIQIRLEIEHLTRRAYLYYGGPVRTRMQEKNQRREREKLERNKRDY